MSDPLCRDCPTPAACTTPGVCQRGKPRPFDEREGQRLEISLDGSHACALFGANLHDGEAAFVKIEGWPTPTYKQEQAAMRAAYEELTKKIGERLPFDIVREHTKPTPPAQGGTPEKKND